jgi:hypothetical protein
MAALNSLSQRLASVSGLSFAGAAVSANLTLTGKVQPLVLATGAVGALLFTIAGIVALFGLSSGQIEWPGDKPSWWAEQGDDMLSGLDKEGAGYWVAGHYETVIVAIAKLNRRRARILHASLTCGALGGICIAAVACTALFLKAPPEQPPSITVRAVLPSVPLICTKLPKSASDHGSR